MTGPIAYARADLTEAIRAALPVDVTVYAAMPERLNPPCVVVVEGTPLLEGDDVGVQVGELPQPQLQGPLDRDEAL